LASTFSEYYNVRSLAKLYNHFKIFDFFRVVVQLLPKGWRLANKPLCSMKKIIAIVCLITLSIAGYSQKTTLPTKDFKSLEVFGPFEVELIKANENKVELDYKGVDKENVVAEIQHGVLKLKLKNKHYWNEWNSHEYRKSNYIFVTIYYKDIDAIKAQAGALVKTSGRLKSKYLAIDCAMGAEVTLDVLSKEMLVKSSMGGVLSLSGQTELLEVKASMGGELKATHLHSKFAYVKAGMGAVVTVNASEELEVSSSFGANVNYIGGPAVLHTSQNMGGEVHGLKN
jgi:hypothetical protein